MISTFDQVDSPLQPEPEPNLEQQQRERELQQQQCGFDGWWKAEHSDGHFSAPFEIMAAQWTLNGLSYSLQYNDMAPAAATGNHSEITSDECGVWFTWPDGSVQTLAVPLECARLGQWVQGNVIVWKDPESTSAHGTITWHRINRPPSTSPLMIAGARFLHEQDPDGDHQRQQYAGLIDRTLSDSLHSLVVLNGESGTATGTPNVLASRQIGGCDFRQVTLLSVPLPQGSVAVTKVEVKNLRLFDQGFCDACTEAGLSPKNCQRWRSAAEGGDWVRHSGAILVRINHTDAQVGRPCFLSAEHTPSEYWLEASSHGSTCTRMVTSQYEPMRDVPVDVFRDLRLSGLSGLATQTEGSGGGGGNAATTTATVPLQEGERIELRLVVPSYPSWTCQCNPVEGQTTLSVQVLARA